jgi:hypothetical protein
VTAKRRGIVVEYVVEVRWNGKGRKQAIERCRLEETANAIAWMYRDEGHLAHVRIIKVKHQKESSPCQSSTASAPGTA